MKRRLIVIAVAVMAILIYQKFMPEPNDFSNEDLLKVRASETVEHVEPLEDGILVFWDNGEPSQKDRTNYHFVAVDYFKPSFMNWQWINGGMHGGDYEEGISIQYIPKKALKKFSLNFGVVVDSSIVEIRLTEKASGNKYSATLIDLEDETVWYIVVPDDTVVSTIECFDVSGNIIYTLVSDNSWLFE